MRRPTHSEAHRGRVAVIEGRFPEGMQARCSWCNSVAPAAEGAFIEPKSRAVGATKLFKCGGCLAKDAAA